MEKYELYGELYSNSFIKHKEEKKFSGHEETKVGFFVKNLKIQYMVMAPYSEMLLAPEQPLLQKPAAPLQPEQMQHRLFVHPRINNK